MFTQPTPRNSLTAISLNICHVFLHEIAVLSTRSVELFLVPSASPSDDIDEQLHDPSRSWPGGQQKGRLHIAVSVRDESLVTTEAESETTEADLASGV